MFMRAALGEGKTGVKVGILGTRVVSALGARWADPPPKLALVSFCRRRLMGTHPLYPPFGARWHQ